MALSPSPLLGLPLPSQGTRVICFLSTSCRLSPAEAFSGRQRLTFGHVNTAWPKMAWLALGPAEVSVPRRARAPVLRVTRVALRLHTSIGN